MTRRAMMSVLGVGVVMLALGCSDYKSSGGQTQAERDYALEGRSRVIRTVGNAYLTFPLPYGLKPYVGGGAGWAFVNAQFTQIVPVLDTSVDPPVVFNVPTPRIRADGDDFTWQAIGGLSYEISKGIFISAEYRYMEIDRMQLGGVAGVGNVAYDFSAHTALIGLRYRFE